MQFYSIWDQKLKKKFENKKYFSIQLCMKLFFKNHKKINGLLQTYYVTYNKYNNYWMIFCPFCSFKRNLMKYIIK